jgi:hypothetical protein
VVIEVAKDILDRAARDGDRVRRIREALRAEAKKAEEDALLAVYASRSHPASNDAEDQPPLSDLSLSEPSPPTDETEGPATYTLIFLTDGREQKLRCRQDVVLGDLIQQNREHLTGWSLRSDARVYSGDGKRLSLLSTLAELGLTDGETLEEMREQTGGAGGDEAAREEPMPLEVQEEHLRQLKEFMDAERSEGESSGDDMEPADHEDAASNETPLTGEKWPTGTVEEQQAGVGGDAPTRRKRRQLATTERRRRNKTVSRQVCGMRRSRRRTSSSRGVPKTRRFAYLEGAYPECAEQSSRG